MAGSAHSKLGGAGGGGAATAAVDRDWDEADRDAALRLLRTLTGELIGLPSLYVCLAPFAGAADRRRQAAAAQEAAAERPPTAPLLLRVPSAEAPPVFVHGHAGALL
jgi:hypothetical protein